ncbi:MAG: hypothetical protein OEW77_11590 [Gemmatimonadota bacterium]|nr:hypothetical protein [Gemmatimonadota bacterium]
MHDHLVYGLRLRCATALPTLASAPLAGVPDVVVRFSVPPSALAALPRSARYVSEATEDGRPVLVCESDVSGDAPRLVFGEGATFTFAAEGPDLWVEWMAPLSMDDVMSFLTGPVLGFALRRLGVLALHASAVSIGGRAVGFVGAGGAGKSTLAAALAARGHAVLTDDVLALREQDGRWLAFPGHDQLRLWEDSEALLFGGSGRLAPLSDTWEKRKLSLLAEGYHLVTAPEPLGALLVLEPPAPRAVAAEVLPALGQETVLSLLGNTSAGYLLGAADRVPELRALSSLLRSVRVGRLRPGARSGPDELCGTVEAWCAALAPGGDGATS